MRFILRVSVFVVVLVVFLSDMIVFASPDRRSAVVEVAEKVGPAVVNIRTEQIVRRRSSPFFGFGGSLFDDFFRGFGETRVYKTQSLGSGVLIDPKGYVLTNAHVIEQASKIFVALAGEQKEREATLVGADEQLDIAVIRVSGEGPFLAIEMARSDDLILGETVVAIGNPLGLGNSVTTGVVSSPHRRVPMGEGFVGHFIQTDALINPGNSGGPLLNIDGDLIGINTAIASQAQGIGFSIPIDMAKRVVNDLITFGQARIPYLGIMPGNVNQALVRSRGVGGVLVTEVEDGSPATVAGIEIADVILSIDGMTVESPREMRQLLGSYTPDSEIELEILRGMEVLKRSVPLQPLPDQYGLLYSSRVFGLEVADGLEGVLISRVVPDSYAEKARIRVGDRISEIAGQETATVAAYEDVMVRHLGEIPLSFLVIRDNRGYYISLP